MIDLDSLVEVKLKEDEDFLKIRETLTRIGVASRKDKTLFQSCHILHKQSRIICHFKELFSMDGKPSNFTEDDMGRRNTIANLLAEWGLVKLVNEDKSKEPVAPLSQIKVPHKEKDEWNLAAKYNIGKKR